MKPIKSIFLVFIGLCIFFSLGIANGASPEAAKIIKELEAKADKEIKMPDIDKGNHKGFKYYLLTDKSIPLVRGGIYIKGGAIYDPLDKRGLSALLTYLVRSGGTKEMTPDQVDAVLDQVASAISIRSGTEEMIVSFNTASSEFENTFNMLLKMLFEPRFDEERFMLGKKHMLNAVKRRADQPDTLASLAFVEQLYGKNNAWGRYVTQATITSITLEDLKKAHKEYFHPKNMVIGIAGDITEADLKNVLSDYKLYPKPNKFEPKMPLADPKLEASISIVDKISNQAVINMGHRGGHRNDPDKFAIIVMNYLLGGATFKSRLSHVIRVQYGLAYTVYSRYTFGPPEAPGYFRVGITIKAPNAKKAIDLALGEINKFVRGDEISENEVEKAKKSILRSLVFEYSSAYSIISNIIRFNYYGYPDNYIEKYEKGIGNVYLDDVKKVAKKHLHPDKMEIIVVGQKQDLKKVLKDYSNIKYITIEN